MQKIRFALITAIIAFGLHACDDEVREWVPGSEQMVITEYVQNNDELFSEFAIALELSGGDNLLKVRGPYTLMLPTNDAMLAYYNRLGVASCYDIDSTELRRMVYNHLFKGPINTGNIGLGTLPYKNGLNDFMASDLPGIEIVLNKEATIIKRDIEVSNGFIHHVDYVMEPLSKTVFEVVGEDGGYTIFTEALKLTGLSDTLEIISFPYGQTDARTDYTLLAVADTLYNREGINSIDDLIATYADGADYTDEKNGLYKYMEYHCLSGTSYFSDFAPNDIYYLMTYDNYLNIKVGAEDFMINPVGDEFTGFYYDQSNFPAKNGAVHSINGQLPYTESEPSEIVFQTTDFFDLQQGSYYGNHYQRFYDGQNTFQGIKWDAEYLLYYIKPAHHLLDDDALNLNGHFWIEITTPKIRAGKYDLSTFMFFGNNAITNCYVDGVFLGEVDPSLGAWGGDPLIIGEVNFEETTTHTIKLKTVVPGGMWWDRVIFTPK